MVLGDTLEEKVSGCSVRQKNEHTNLPYKADATEDTEKLVGGSKNTAEPDCLLGTRLSFLGKRTRIVARRSLHALLGSLSSPPP